jgi:microcystin-dependent protein
MAYTKHSWEEKTGTGTNKATWMNNMETQYDEVVSYYTTTLHDASYYTEAQAAALFFAPTYDGTGSGFVAETLDGYTAVGIIAAQVAAGTVAIWGSSEASIPAGWHLCDGRDANTPDIRGKFPTAAGTSYVLGATGGAATVSSSAATVTIATYAITTAEMGSHSHTGITDRNDNVNTGNTSYAYTNGPDTAQTRNTGAAGSNSGHTHAGSSVAAGLGTANNNLPQYKAYCYIVKE